MSPRTTCAGSAGEHGGGVRGRCMCVRLQGGSFAAHLALLEGQGEALEALCPVYAVVEARGRRRRRVELGLDRRPGQHDGLDAGEVVDEGLIDNLVDDLNSTKLFPKIKSTLSYARKLTKTPSKMVLADADLLYAAGWDEDALMNIVEIS